MKFLMNIYSSCANINPNSLVPRGKGFVRDNVAQTKLRSHLVPREAWVEFYYVYAHTGALLTAVLWPRSGICIHIWVYNQMLIPLTQCLGWRRDI